VGQATVVLVKVRRWCF